MRDQTEYLRNSNTYSPAAEIADEEVGGRSLQPPSLSLNSNNTQTIQRDTGTSSQSSSENQSTEHAAVNEGANGPGSEIEQARSEFQRGRAMYARRNYQGALVMFQRALHRSGLDQAGSVDIVYNLGMCNYRLHRFPAAINYFEMYSNYDPENETVQRYLSESRRRSNASNQHGEITGENEYASEAGSIREERPEESGGGSSELTSTFQRALRQYRNGDYRSATYLFEQVRQAGDLSGRDNADLLFNLGKCNMHLHRYSTAVFYFHQYLQVNPGDPEATEALRLCEQQSGII